MFQLETLDNGKYRIVYDFFDMTYIQPGVEFSTKELARKHYSALMNGDTTHSQMESFITQYWKGLQHYYTANKEFVN